MMVLTKSPKFLETYFKFTASICLDDESETAIRESAAARGKIQHWPRDSTIPYRCLST